LKLEGKKLESFSKATSTKMIFFITNTASRKKKLICISLHACGDKKNWLNI